MKPLRLGFIGGGINSAVGRAHYAASRMDGRFEVVGGKFSDDIVKCRESALAFTPATEAYTAQYACISERELLSKDIDAVVVLSPTPMHLAHVSLVLEANVPVVCEKALATTSAQAASLCRLREETNGFLAVTYNYTGYPMVRELRDMILRGELGEVISVQAEMPQEGYLRAEANPQAWRRKDGEIPGVHLDLGTHLHHLIHFVTGDRPAQLVAHQTRNSRFDVVDDVQCIAEYQSGFTASIQFGKTALGHRNGLRIRVNGTLASAEWRQSEPEELRTANSDGYKGIVDRASPLCHVASLPRYQRFKAGHPAGFIEAYANLYSDLAEWLSDYKNGAGERNRIFADGATPLIYSPKVAHEGLVMMEAMVKSAKEKQWVTV